MKIESTYKYDVFPSRILHSCSQIQQQRNNLNKMKAPVFYACVLALVCFSLADITKEKLKQTFAINDDSFEDNFDTCMTENDMTQEDWYTEENIIHEEYKEPGNEERRRKCGCTMECFLKKLGLMVGSDIKENKVHEEINRKMNGDPKQGKAHKIARDCMREVKNITQECEKGFSLVVCVVNKASNHGEHGHE